MNAAWIFDWWTTTQLMYTYLERYETVVAVGYFNPDEPRLDRAFEWEMRSTYLNICLNLVRDLYWHDLSRSLSRSQNDMSRTLKED